MKTLRAFLAHPKGIEGADLDSLYRKVGAALTAKYSDIVLVMITGKDEWHSSFKAQGSWKAWCRYVALGENFATRGPLYDLFIVAPEITIGAATKDIVELALSKRKTVAFWSQAHGFQRVRGITTLDTENFKSGWCVVL